MFAQHSYDLVRLSCNVSITITHIAPESGGSSQANVTNRLAKTAEVSLLGSATIWIFLIYLFVSDDVYFESATEKSLAGKDTVGLNF